MRHVLGLAVLALACSNPRPRGTGAAREALRSVSQASRGRLTLPFVEADGKFVQRRLARDGATSFFDERGFALSLSDGKSGWGLRASIVGARAVKPVAEKPEATTVSSYVGNDPARWRAASPTYGRLVWEDALPGVDMIAEPTDGGFAYRYVIAPGASAHVSMRWEGAKAIRANGASMTIETGVGEVTVAGLHAYAIEGDQRRELPSRFVVGGDVVTIAVEGWSGSVPLVIDPTVMFASYLGGSNSDYGHGVASDASGNVYLTGTVGSPDFPVPGGFDTSISNYDAYITKLTPTTDAIVWSSFLGGTGVDEGRGVAVDGSGNVFLAGFEASTDFPVPGGFDTTHAGTDDGFVAKVTSSGALSWSSYLGGSDRDRLVAIAVGGSGNVFVAGQTWSNDLATTGGWDTTFGGGTDAMVAKISGGGALLWTSYFGGGGNDQATGIDVDPTGNAFVTGIATGSTALATAGAYDTSYNGNDDAFVFKVTSGATLAWSTYLGGTAADTANALVVDSAGDVIVAGATASTDFPDTKSTSLADTTAGNTDGFVTKLTSAGAMVWSRYLGGAGGSDVVNGITVDASKNIYLTGNAISASFPIVGGFEPTYRGGVGDAFFAKMAPAGTITWSTYLGGSMGDYGRSIVVGTSGDLWIGGYTNSPDFPTIGGFDTTVGSTAQDAFILRYRPEQSANGAACTAGMNCTSTFCADGVCCDTACNGAWQACAAAKKYAGAEGTCGAIADGHDPDVECAAASCASSVVTNAQVCNGSGACRSAGTASCGDYQCKGAACGTTCVADGDCIASAYCSSGSCTPKKANGASCTATDQCTSGFCADGVCCDKACNGACEACTTAKKGSGADGVCANVAADTDPKDMCATDPGYPASCKADGMCDGGGACRIYAKSGVSCGATSCIAATVSGKSCNGGGTCDSTPKSCGLYACDAGGAACKTACTVDGDCTGGSFCNKTGACEAKKANGASCAATNECSSAFCVDSVCCGSVCTGQCEACDVAGSEGTCTAVVGATHSTREKCAGDAALCGGTCDGTNRASCTYPTATKSCGNACSSGSETKSSCNGAGSCVEGSSVSCGAYACSGSSCAKTCSADTECATGFHCDSGACVPKSAAAPKCSDDQKTSTAPDGKVTSCGTYLCDTSSGICRAVCGTSDDCVTGNVCNLSSRQCEPATAATDDGGGCSHSRVPASGTPMFLLVLSSLLARRRHRLP
jgi:hypothetical protein